MCELLHTSNASFLECGEHAVGTEWRAVVFSAGGGGETMADVARTYAVDATTIGRLAASSPFEQSAAAL